MHANDSLTNPLNNKEYCHMSEELNVKCDDIEMAIEPDEVLDWNEDKIKWRYDMAD
jgi:hypothetical protein